MGHPVQDPGVHRVHWSVHAGDGRALRRVGSSRCSLPPCLRYLCASKTHGHHGGEGDSVYHQNRLQGEYFSHLRQRGVYINQPDTYWYQGGSKTGMGYDEQQFSLPRWQDLAISRQTLYDNTFNKVGSE